MYADNNNNNRDDDDDTSIAISMLNCLASYEFHCGSHLFLLDMVLFVYVRSAVDHTQSKINQFDDHLHSFINFNEKKNN